jgi:hypothetical protein
MAVISEEVFGFERPLGEGSGARTAGLIPDWLNPQHRSTLHVAAAI